jgi:hypothetical protein
MSEQQTNDRSVSLSAVVQQFGGAREEFRPSTANLIAGIIIGLLLIVGGLVLAVGSLYMYLSPKGSELQSTILGVAVGFGLVGCGVLFIYLMWRLFAYRLVVCPRGFVRQVRKDIHSCLWDDIASVTETVTTDHLPLNGAAKLIPPMGKSRTYEIRRKDGLEFSFTSDTVKRLGRFAKIVREEVDRRGIPWSVQS